MPLPRSGTCLKCQHLQPDSIAESPSSCLALGMGLHRRRNYFSRPLRSPPCSNTWSEQRDSGHSHRVPPDHMTPPTADEAQESLLPSKRPGYAPGQLLEGRYEIQALLGKGSVGETYLALDVLKQRLVALKFPRVQLAGDLTLLRRFRKELQIGGSLDHPNIQRTYPEESTNGSYGVFEYVEGESLRHHLAARGKLSVAEVRSIGSQLASALAYVHEHRVVHRDVKPDNVLITPDGRVKLADFGISAPLKRRLLEWDDPGNAAGTPGYMPPEQVRGRLGEARTDVYALGATLYELLTGHLPYSEADSHPVDGSQPILASDNRAETPPALDAVLYKALRRDPTQRYQSMAAFEQDLQHLDQVQIPQYEPDLAAPRPLGDLPPLRVVAAATTAFLALLGVLGWLAQSLHRTGAGH